MEILASKNTTIIIHSLFLPRCGCMHRKETVMTQYQVMHMENIMVVSDEWYNHYDDDEEDP